MQTELDRMAKERDKAHAGQKSNRPLSVDNQKVGLAGELGCEEIFKDYIGWTVDRKLRKGGDGGIDFRVPLFYTIDVKTARKPKHLMVEVGKVRADIYILAKYKEDGAVELIGWEWGAIMATLSTIDYGMGIVAHAQPAIRLRPMTQLMGRMVRKGTI